MDQGWNTCSVPGEAERKKFLRPVSRRLRIPPPVKRIQWRVRDFINSTSLFAKPPAEPFPSSTGTIPAEWKKSLELLMGEQSMKTIPASSRQSGGLVNSSLVQEVAANPPPPTTTSNSAVDPGLLRRRMGAQTYDYLDFSGGGWERKPMIFWPIFPRIPYGNGKSSVLERPDTLIMNRQLRINF